MPSILHLVPTLERGGAERQLAMLATEQFRRGWTVHLAMRRVGDYGPAVKGPHIHLLGDLKGLHPLLVVRTGRLIYIKPDIVQSWLGQMDIVAGVLAPISSSSWILCERSSKQMYERNPLINWGRSQLGRLASAIIANSDDGAEFWARARPGSLVGVVPNALDIEAISGAAAIGSCDGSNVILYVGRFSPEKAPLAFVEAISIVPHELRIKAKMVGDGPLLKDIQQAIAQYKLEDRIELLPWDLNWWGRLKSANALVSTSVVEGHPNVVLEAMVAKCPVVITDISAHRAIVDCKAAIFSPPNDGPKLASNIVSVCRDPDAARNRAERAYQYVKDLTIAKTADAYERVYAVVRKN